MNYTNDHGLPQSIYDAIVKNTYDVRQDDPLTLSVTSLIDEPKYVTLKKRHFAEITEDISDAFWLLLGSAVHEVLARINPVGRIIEQRYAVERKGFVITGKPDISEDQDDSIQDYKVTSVYAYIYSPTGKKEWIRQLNVYAWLKRSAGLQVRKLQNNLILRDWSRLDALKDPSYPQIPFKVVDIPLFDNATIAAFIDAQLDAHAASWEMADDDIPPCKPESRWHGEDVFAVYKSKEKSESPNSRALKLFDKEEDARSHARGMVPAGFVQYRPGEDKRCKDYCPVCKFCSFGRVRYPETANVQPQ